MPMHAPGVSPRTADMGPIAVSGRVKQHYFMFSRADCSDTNERIGHVVLCKKEKKMTDLIHSYSNDDSECLGALARQCWLD
jgi:hypothetical protein